MTKEDLLKNLKDWQARMPNKWGIFVGGKQVFITSSNVYASKGAAKRKLREFSKWSGGMSITDAELDALLASGEVEIKEIK